MHPWVVVVSGVGGSPCRVSGLLLAGLALGSLFAFVPPVRAQAIASPAQSALAGSRVFGVKGCVRCHSINGMGGTEGPDLGAIARNRTYYELGAAMWNHLPSMLPRMRDLDVPVPRLSPREAGDLIAFLYTLDYFGEEADLDRGQRIFTAKGCVRCHQVGGVGGVIGPGLDHLQLYRSPMLVAAAMWNHGPIREADEHRSGLPRPTFTGRDLQDLIGYLESAAPMPQRGGHFVLPGRAPEGQRLFADKACVRCHSVNGLGGSIGGELANRARFRNMMDFAAAMWNKAPRMLAAMRQNDIAVPGLDQTEMADIVAYLYSVQYFAQSGVPGRGRRVFQSKGCLDCHALDRQGARTAGDLAQYRGITSPAGVISALWNHGLLEQPVFGDEWPGLTAKEMADLAAALQIPRGDR